METFWRMAARFIIGVPVRAPNEAVLGDLGWDPFAVRAAWQVASLWCRASRMPQDELLKKALLEQKRWLGDLGWDPFAVRAAWQVATG